MRWYLHLWLKLLFRDILRMICHTDFKCEAEEMASKILAPRHCPINLFWTNGTLVENGLIFGSS